MPEYYCIVLDIHIDTVAIHSGKKYIFWGLCSAPSHNSSFTLVQTINHWKRYIAIKQNELKRFFHAINSNWGAVPGRCTENDHDPRLRFECLSDIHNSDTDSVILYIDNTV